MTPSIAIGCLTHMKYTQEEKRLGLKRKKKRWKEWERYFRFCLQFNKKHLSFKGRDFPPYCYTPNWVSNSALKVVSHLDTYRLTMAVKFALQYPNVINPRAESKQNKTKNKEFKTECVILGFSQTPASGQRGGNPDKRNSPFKSVELCEIPKEDRSRSGGVKFLRKTRKNGEGGGWKDQTLLRVFQECAVLPCLDGQGFCLEACYYISLASDKQTHELFPNGIH